MATRALAIGVLLSATLPSVSLLSGSMLAAAMLTASTRASVSTAAPAARSAPRPPQQARTPKPRPRAGAPAAGTADAALFGAMLGAEDRRAATRDEQAPLLRGLDASHAPAVQVAALLGLGRLERDDLVPEIARLLDAPVPAVRIEAANALGQAVTTGDARLAAAPLTARARVETDAAVRGAIARTIGRLPYRMSSDVGAAEELLIALSRRDDASTAATGAAAAAGVGAGVATTRESEPVTLYGVAHGFASLARKSSRIQPLSAQALARLRQLARYGLSGVSGEPLRQAGAGASDALPAESSAAAGSLSGGAVGPAVRREEIAPVVRRLALSALAAAKDADAALLEAAAADPDPQVRRQAIVTAIAGGPTPQAEMLATAARRDASFMVRYDALRVLGRLRAAAAPFVPSATLIACEPELDALSDENAHVVLLAIDQLAACTGPSAATAASERLTLIADERVAARASAAPAATAATATTTATAATAANAHATNATATNTTATSATVTKTRATSAGAWHRSAHAIVSLAHVAPDRARARLAAFAADGVWQVRLYAARAAGVVKDRATLETLAADRDDNVRNAAVEALQPIAGHDADAIYLAQLARDDYQLVRTAARALSGSPRAAEATPALLAAFARITAQRRDTSRDPRIALLEALEKTSAAIDGTASALEPALTDFDPIVAARAAAVLNAWSGQPAGREAQPRPLPRVAPPAHQELASLRSTVAIVHMASGRAFTLALFPMEAPTNVARFVRQARAGYFTQLTFHRVEPNFVIQGGSPHANEYWGDARFTRDEVGLRSHLRGTVGISTRGHDTGDGQIFVNLVDNVRLDHSYTIIGAVTDGLDTIDGMLEGDAIARIELRQRP